MASIFRPSWRGPDGQVHHGEVWHGRIYYKGRKRTRSLGTTSKSIAKLRLGEWVDELKAAGWKSSVKHSFADASRRFQAEHFPRLKPSSADRYGTSLIVLARAFDARKIEDLSRSDLSAFEAERRKGGAANATIRRDLSCLSAMLSCAIDWGWLPANVATLYLKSAGRRGLEEAPPRTRYLSHEEEQTILSALEGQMEMRLYGSRDFHRAFMLWAAMILAVDTGLRREELLGLEWRDVDIDQNQIIIRGERAKSGLYRAVPLLPRARKLLVDNLPRRTRCVLHDSNGERYTDLAPQFKAAAAACGITDVRWHDLRRTCGCRLLQDLGLPMEKVSLWLGHASIALTQRAYAFLDVRHLHAALVTSKQT